MPTVRALAAFAFALMLVGFSADGAEAQSPISAEGMKAAQAAAGTARVVEAQVISGDSLIISVEDDQLTSAAIWAGEWRLGGREGTPRAVGRTIVEATRHGLPAQSPVKIIVLEVAGTPPAQLRFFYRTADLAPL